MRPRHGRRSAQQSLMLKMWIPRAVNFSVGQTSVLIKLTLRRPLLRFSRCFAIDFTSFRRCQFESRIQTVSFPWGCREADTLSNNGECDAVRAKACRRAVKGDAGRGRELLDLGDRHRVTVVCRTFGGEGAQ
jgi:hypothetical protein